MEKKKEFKITKGAFITKQDKLFDSYDLDPSIIGTGNFGMVKKAVHKITKQERAVKIIPKVKIKNLDRFKMEVEIMRKVDHPNIVKMFEWFEDEKSMYLILEFCGGGELFERITSMGKFSEKDAAIIFRQILNALHYCHKNKIVHRDLKPENFLFESRKPDAPLKLIDFGLSKIFEDPKIGFIKLKTKAGTPYYIAPEVMGGDYDYKCDMWSAGVILYILTCGFPPFYGENEAEILESVKRAVYTFEGEEWAHVSHECKELITKLLAKDPAKRYTAEQAVNHIWIKTLAGSAKAGLSVKHIANMQSFKSLQRLKRSVVMYIASQTCEKEIKQLRELFMSLDKDGDGKLSIEEIKEAAGSYKGTVNLTELFEAIDVDKSQFIDYTEFLAATMDKELYMNEDRLAAALKHSIAF